MFDTFVVDDCDGQVKMYDRTMENFKEGDTLPNPVFPLKRSDIIEEYAIKLRYGGWVIVKNNTFFKYQEEVPCLPHLFDKWGRDWNLEQPVYD